MDTTGLQHFRTSVDAALTTAEQAETPRGTDAAWDSLPAIYESLGNVTTQLIDLAIAIPDDHTHARAAATRLLDGTIGLYGATKRPVPCAVEVPVSISPDGVLNAFDCERYYGHTGDHLPDTREHKTLMAAGGLLYRAAHLNHLISSTLLDPAAEDDEATAREITRQLIEQIRSHLDELEDTI